MALQITVCHWNIQNYGGQWLNPKFGNNSALRNRFICNYLTRWRVDILLVMEVSIWAYTDLQNLVTQLNAASAGNTDWALSYCGSAIRNGGRNPHVDNTDITFLSDARSEGYAVIWRTNQPAIYRMLPSLVNVASNTWAPVANPAPPATTPLNFVTTGRPADTVEDYIMVGRRRRKVEAFRALGGYTVGQVFPYDDNGLMNHWPDLLFPTTSVLNHQTVARTGARRPAFVVIEQANGAGTTRRRLCPLIVYHAPSNQGRASFGAFMAGLSRELYVTNDLTGAGAPDPLNLVHNDSVVIGGDYNYSVDTADWPEDYQYHTENFRVAYTGGANLEDWPRHTGADATRRSTVQLLHGDHVTPIISGTSTDYFRHMIDLVFTRDSAATTMQGFRMNVVQELMNDAGGARFGATLQAVDAAIDAHLLTLAGPNYRLISPNGCGPEVYTWTTVGGRFQQVWRPVFNGSWGSTFDNWTTFKTQLAAGQLTGARQAAEYYHMFVSDHLPLLTDLDW